MLVRNLVLLLFFLFHTCIICGTSIVDTIGVSRNEECIQFRRMNSQNVEHFDCKRAPSRIPTVYYKDECLYVMSTHTLQFSYVIFDEAGAVMSGEIYIIPNEERIIPIADIIDGDYELQLTIGFDIYVGNFTVE